MWHTRLFAHQRAEIYFFSFSEKALHKTLQVVPACDIPHIKALFLKSEITLPASKSTSKDISLVPSIGPFNIGRFPEIIIHNGKELVLCSLTVNMGNFVGGGDGWSAIFSLKAYIV